MFYYQYHFNIVYFKCFIFNIFINTFNSVFSINP